MSSVAPSVNATRASATSGATATATHQTGAPSATPKAPLESWPGSSAGEGSVVVVDALGASMGRAQAPRVPTPATATSDISMVTARPSHAKAGSVPAPVADGGSQPYTDPSPRR